MVPSLNEAANLNSIRIAELEVIDIAESQNVSNGPYIDAQERPDQVIQTPTLMKAQKSDFSEKKGQPNLDANTIQEMNNAIKTLRKESKNYDLTTAEKVREIKSLQNPQSHNSIEAQIQ